MQQVVLNPQTIEQIRMQTRQEWRKCQRKRYEIHACKLPEGYVFANCLEQPESYRAIMQTFHKPIVPVEDVMGNNALSQWLGAHGCYKTSSGRVVLCGTKGELWDVTEDKLRQSYVLPTGQGIRNIPDEKWFTIARMQEVHPSAVGIQLPKDYVGIYQTSWATLTVNNHQSKGHGKGDILVAPMLPNGQPDYGNISPTNNEVFALTYNLGVGGWGSSGLITKPESIKPVTLIQCNDMVKKNVASKAKTGISKTRKDQLLALARKWNLKETYDKILRIDNENLCTGAIVCLRVLDKYISEHSNLVKSKIDDSYFLDNNEYSCNFSIAGLTGEVFHILWEGSMTNSKQYHFCFWGWGKGYPEDPYECNLKDDSIDVLYSHFCDVCSKLYNV